jgi:hypothetical protein
MVKTYATGAAANEAPDREDGIAGTGTPVTYFSHVRPDQLAVATLASFRTCSAQSESACSKQRPLLAPSGLELTSVNSMEYVASLRPVTSCHLMPVVIVTIRVPGCLPRLRTKLDDARNAASSELANA